MRPNIILILCDDLGWRDLGCYGSAFYETPRLDRLATEGMRFTDAYAASPVCSPTRASILCGKYPARIGITNYIGGHATGRLIDAPFLDHLPTSEVSLARALHEGGYATWHVGKWHLGGSPYTPLAHGFEVNIGGGAWGRPPRSYFAPWGIDTLPEGDPGAYLTDRLTDHAIDLIRQRDGRPFFLNLCHYAVHTPIEAPVPLVDKYRAKARRLGLDRLPVLEAGECFPCSHKRAHRVQRRRLQSDPTYAAMMENLDTNVGRVLDALEEEGIAEDTIVVFTSDNGGLATAEGSPTCNAPLVEGKGWMYDGGVREPLLVRWPGRVRSGAVCTEPVISCDFYPTFLEAAGLPLRPAQHTDGVSLLPLLRASGCLAREAIFWHYPHYGNQGGTPGAAVRVGDAKLMHFFEDEHLELYDLRQDISQAHNLVETQPERASVLDEMLRSWLKAIGATLPGINPDWAE